MKSATFGLSRTHLSRHPPASSRPCGPLAFQARADYMLARTNGTPGDCPTYNFPADGTYSWHEHTDHKYLCKYSEGPGDRKWMEQCDRNYLARLEVEKAAARKRECEAELRDNKEQPKRLEAASSKADPARLTALQAQQSQPPGTKPSLSEVSLAAHQGNSHAQFQLGQRYADGLDVKLDKKEAFKWFRIAAGQEHALAQLAVGRAYEKGEGIEKSLLKAREWYFHAYRHHAPNAEKRLVRVKQRIAKRRKSSSHHRSTTPSTQNSTSHSSGGNEQKSVGMPNRTGLDDSDGRKVMPVTAGNATPGYQVHSEAQRVNTDPNYPLHAQQAGSSNATGGYSLDSGSLKPPPPIPTTTFLAEVLYPLQGASPEELTLSAGAKVQVVEQVSPEWWRCEHSGHAGLVPSQYLRTLSSAQVSSASPEPYTSYTTPSSGEAAGSAGIFTAAAPNLAATNQSRAPGADEEGQMILDNRPLS
jgi:SH3 domain/Sel1 repeat